MEQKKRNSFYDPIYVSKRDNISIERAKARIDEMKMNKTTSLAGFIYRHGEEIGREKFEQFRETSKHTREKYIKKYGEELGEVKWAEYISTKDSTSYAWALKKSDGDENKAKTIHTDRIDKLSIKFDLNYFITKYGEEKSEEMMKSFLESKDSCSYKWALKKANNDYKKADIIYQERSDTKKFLPGRASKESLLVFEPIKEWLNSIQIYDILYGVKNNKELCIYDKVNKVIYYYDFCIESLKLIIEYNGEMFHPNYEKYDITFLNENWKHPFNKTANVGEYLYKDKTKINYAIKNGYDIHIIWSSDKDKIEKLKNIIKNKIKTNENKKNI